MAVRMVLCKAVSLDEEDVLLGCTWCQLTWIDGAAPRNERLNQALRERVDIDD